MPKLQRNTEGAAIVEDEERLHARVQSRIAAGAPSAAAAASNATAGDLDRELLALRDAVAEAKPEDLAPLVEQMTRLAALRSQIGGSKSLPVDPQSPYFAHMVLREGDKTRDVLIGKRGFIDRGANVQIVDWRNAPISQVYYRYDEGDDFEEEVDGRTFQGVIDVRRNVSIRKSKLRRIGAPQGTFVRDREDEWHEAVGDLKPTLQGGVGKAARAPKAREERKGDRKSRRGRRRGRGGRGGTLGVHHEGSQRADKHLPEIAALIDAQQFDLISRPESGMVVIQGGAGSGKTTVALHRVAFLAFADRERFRPSRMLFVVPTRSLVRYVEGVLPALGVRGVPVVTYAGWARKQRLRLLNGSSNKYNTDTPDSVSRTKKHPALLAMLAELVAEQTREAGVELRALDPRLGEQWAMSSELALVPRLRKLFAWAKGNQGLSPEDRARFHSTLKRLGRRADDVLADWSELLTDRSRLSKGFAEHGPKTISERDIEQCVAWCTTQQSEGTAWTDDAGEPIESVDGHRLSDDDPEGRFDHEDDPLLLRLIQLKRGGLVAKGVGETWYEHIAIDEAQDRSAIEIKVLLDAVAEHGGDATARSVTIAGDTAQRLVFDNHFGDWGELLLQVGYSRAQAEDLVQPLSLSYRSTAEVMRLAREILGPELAPKDDLMARNGAPVEVHSFGDVGEAVAFAGDALRALMLREPTASVAVVGRYAEQADLYYAGLKRAEVPALRRVRNHEFDFTPGIDVTDVSQVKGLEFDYVIMIEVGEASYPGSVEARHLLHIGVTRAAHQLWILTTGEVSPLIPDEYCDLAG